MFARLKKPSTLAIFTTATAVATLIKHKKIMADHENPSLVNIEGLPKERVLIALFENAHKKSAASYGTYRSITDHVFFENSKAPIGTDYPPTEEEARRILASSCKKRKCPIDYIGTVKIDANFNGASVDFSHYDKAHKKTINSNVQVKTAQQCIDDLRQKVALEEKLAAEEIQRDRAIMKHEQEQLDNINRYIRQILNNDECRFNPVLFEIVFKSEQSIETLQQYADRLTEAGLVVTIHKNDPLFSTIKPSLDLGTGNRRLNVPGNTYLSHVEDCLSQYSEKQEQAPSSQYKNSR